MPRLIAAFIGLSSLLILASCNSTTPQKYFEIAVLNTNMLSGFATSGMERELESPSITLGKDGSQVPMKRSEILESKISFTEETLSKLNSLKVTDETCEMIETSKALHAHVLAAYARDYKELARLYDQGAPEVEIRQQSKAIEDKYLARAAQLHTKLIELGKVYAAKNDIKVNWDIRTSPR